MSLSRLLLRGKVVTALTQQPGDVGHPTVAGPNVFDSRFDNVEFDGEKMEMPVVCVYTDTDASQLMDYGAGTGANFRKMTLRVDILMASFQKVVTDGETQMKYGLPGTSAELEATMDLFEMQVLRALRIPGRKASEDLGNMVQSWLEFTSEVERSVEGNNRLAGRRLTFTLRIKQDCYPKFGTGPIVPRPNETPKIHSMPWLDDMIKVFADDPNLSGLLDQMYQEAGYPSVYLPLLKRVGVQLAVADFSTALASEIRTNGVQILQTWKIPT